MNEAPVLKAFLRQKLSYMRLANLASAHFAAYRDERLARVKGATVRRELATVRHCLEVARGEWSIPLPANPLKAVKLPPDSRARDRRLGKDEGASLMDAMTTPSSWYLRPFLILAVETGMRRGELLSIRWCDVELGTRTVRILKTAQTQMRAEHTLVTANSRVGVRTNAGRGY
jgi:integrase